ncbi:MAG: hypothetical protein ACRELC_02870, partial [Gemmatimonadota bacterium]
LVQLLGRDVPGRIQHWEEVLGERGLDPVLDDPATLEALLADPGVSTLPASLVVYVLLRRTLLDSGIPSRLLADYLASLVVHFGRAGRSYRIAEHDDREYRYLVDIVDELSRASGRRAFLLRAHLGNFALWLSGLFPDHIVHRVDRKGGPGIDYYEELGQTGFRLAADDPFARRRSLDALYRDVAMAFSPMRRALNRFSDAYVTPRPASPVDRLLRQVKNDFEDGWLQA